MRNAEMTKERILRAAKKEFSAHGIAGARVDRIAKAAGCNKNLIYIYFENKESLFTTVLQKNLVSVYEEIKFTPDDLPGYATRMFDFVMANPELIRLMTWFGLEQNAENPPERLAALQAKLSAISKAQTEGHLGDGFPAFFLLTSISALARAWSVANPYETSLDRDGRYRPSNLRELLAEAVTLLVSHKNSLKK